MSKEKQKQIDKFFNHFKMVVDVNGELLPIEKIDGNVIVIAVSSPERRYDDPMNWDDEMEEKYGENEKTSG